MSIYRCFEGDIYRILALMKIETDIISSITPSLIGPAVIFVIMFVETFKTDAIVFICNIIICLISH